MPLELVAVTRAIPDGQAVAVGEFAAMRLGRESTSIALDSALKRQAPPAEEKGLQDIYHACEHLASTGRVLFGNNATAAAWVEPGRRAPMAEGWPGCSTTSVRLRSSTPR